MEPSATYLMPLAAESAEALVEKARAYADWLARPQTAELPLDALCRAAGARQAGGEHRLAIVFQSREELSQRLAAYTGGQARARAWSGRRGPAGSEKTAFVFCGQGAQSWGMGRRLIETEPRFRAALERCDRAFSPLAGWSVRSELLAPESASRLSQTEVAQPTLLAFQIALAELWGELGIRPAAVIGHSLGELAAAHISGALSLSETMRLAYHRARLMQRATGRGRMAAVSLPLERAQQAILGYEGRVCVAACNSPVSTVLAGDSEALQEVLIDLGKRGAVVRLLGVDYAFHSHQMEPFLDELVSALGTVSVQPPVVPVFSTVTGTRVGRREGDFTADYWRRNVRQPVLFRQALEVLIKEGCRTFLEVGPHPVLWVDINHCLEEMEVDGTAVSSLQRGEDDMERLLSSLGRLYTLGLEPRWPSVYPGAAEVELPAVEASSVPSTPDPLARWFHEERWEPRPRRAEDWLLQAGQAGEADAAWLLLEDGGGVSRALRQVAAAAGLACESAAPGDFRRALAAGPSGGRRRWSRVVFLRGLDAAETDGKDAWRVEAELLGVIQEMVRAGLRDAPALWIVTRAAQSATLEDRLRPAQAPLWGLARVAMHEHPALRCALVDLDPERGSPAEARQLAGLIQGEDVENQVAIRRNVVLAPRLKACRVPKTVTTTQPLAGDATFLVAGGFGALGLRVAHWMVARGARRVALWGRSRPSREALDAIALLRQTGAEISVAQIDLADSDALRRALAEERRGAAPIKGVVDCAGTLLESPLLNLSAEGLSAALRDKASVARNLARACDELEPSFLILFSSVFALLGAAGQAALATADAYVDALARERRVAGKPAVAVRWAPWAGAGIGARLSERACHGLPRLAPDTALDVLDRLLSPEAPPVVCAGPFNARQWRQSCVAVAGLPLLSGLDEAHGTGAAPARSARAKLETAPVAARAEILREHVRQTVADVLGRVASSIALDAPLDRLGLGSLKAVELRNQLEDSLGLKLPATLAWGGHATVAHFVSHLAGRMSIPLGAQGRRAVEDPALARLFEALSRVPD